MGDLEERGLTAKAVEIAGRKVGPGHPCFIVAEAGVNHNGDMKLARELVDAAQRAGCDAVKFQSFKTELYVTAHTPKAQYSLAGTDPNESHMEMIKGLELSREQLQELIEYSRKIGIMFLSSPFEVESADILAELGLPAFKVPSGELTNLPLLERVARKRKPVILSTGMATLGEVETGVRTIERAGNHDIVLLHCTSVYPTEPQDVNLRAMQTLSFAFGLPVGYSDHTLGTQIALAAAAMGACVIEKHLTVDRKLPGPDHRASLEPGELGTMVKGVRIVEAALGDGRKAPVAAEADTAIVARKSLVAARTLDAGTVLTEAMIGIKRPGLGLAPAMLPLVLGRKLKKKVKADALLSLDMLE
jgi:N-acetylneuraminate synthase